MSSFSSPNRLSIDSNDVLDDCQVLIVWLAGDQQPGVHLAPGRAPNGGSATTIAREDLAGLARFAVRYDERDATGCASASWFRRAASLGEFPPRQTVL
jgi:hypothetical protein